MWQFRICNLLTLNSQLDLLQVREFYISNQFYHSRQSRVAKSFCRLASNGTRCSTSTWISNRPRCQRASFSDASVTFNIHVNASWLVHALSQAPSIYGLDIIAAQASTWHSLSVGWYARWNLLSNGDPKPVCPPGPKWHLLKKHIASFAITGLSVQHAGTLWSYKEQYCWGDLLIF